MPVLLWIFVAGLAMSALALVGTFTSRSSGPSMAPVCDC